MHKGFWRGDLKERDDLADLSIKRREALNRS
jgi:hypothetical protein